MSTIASRRFENPILETSPEESVEGLDHIFRRVVRSGQSQSAPASQNKHVQAIADELS
jgi:hypothetical protein